MAYGINGNLYFVQDPSATDAASNNRTRNFYGSQTFRSANAPIIYSALWTSSGNSESDEPLASNYSSGNGDVINVLFDVYAVTDGTAVFPTDWKKVATIRKSRDIRNISDIDPNDGGDGRQSIPGHTFTVDISEICKDLVNYSLIPRNKGTWNSWKYGGLNGGLTPQDNLVTPQISNKMILTPNGAFKVIRVQIRTEILDGNGIVREATVAGSYKDSNNNVTIVNSAEQRTGYNPHPALLMSSTGSYMHNGWGTSRTYARAHQNETPNFNYTGSITEGKKIAHKVLVTDGLEQLQWCQRDAQNSPIWNAAPGTGEVKYGTTNTSDLLEHFFMQVDAFDKAGNYLRTARLFDWNENLIPKTTINGCTGVWPRSQYRFCAQNVSPVFINANCIHENSTTQDTWENGGTTYTRYEIDTNGASLNSGALFLNDDVEYYRISGKSITTTQGNGTGQAKANMFEYRFYQLDRDLMPVSNEVQEYGGVYYTELRSDATTNTQAIRFKGLMNFNVTMPKFVKLYWLDATGGISSYVCKMNITTSYDNQKNTILRKQGDPLNTGQPYNSTYQFYPINTSTATSTAPASSIRPNPYVTYYSDSLRGMDVYKGGVEVLTSSVVKRGSAMSEPLHEFKAEWLKGAALSPNVWTEERLSTPYPDVSPNNRLYWKTVSDIKFSRSMWAGGRHNSNFQFQPIIITNTEIETYDASKGLVTITFEYMYAHPYVNQRN